MREIKKLFDIVGHRKETLYLILLSVIVAMVEFVGLALIIPYISVATMQEIPNNSYLDIVLDFLEINKFSEFMMFVSMVVVVFYFLRLISNLLLQYVSLKYIFKLRYIVMSKLFSRYSRLDYAYFVCRNSSEFKKTLLSESLNAQNILKAMIDIISESFVLIFLLGLIFYTDWTLSLALIIVFAGIFYSFVFLFKKRIIKFSERRVGIMKGVHQEMDEAFNNFKFIKLIGAEDVKIQKFNQLSSNMSHINMWIQFMNQMPRYIIETFGLIIIVGIIFYSTVVNNDSSEDFIVILGIYAVAFYRALPSLNKIIVSFNSFQYFKNTIDQIHNDLEINTDVCASEGRILFNQTIELKGIDFQYIGANKNIFRNYNLLIRKGEKIALVGKSGVGKSTLADIVLGVLKPDKGLLLVDGEKVDESNMKSWRGLFGYIPQEIYLYDGTVAENITFGREYDEEKIIKVLNQANIYEYLKTQKGIDTLVGEGGIQLSGGQKQRIGIARALYTDPDILVLDEATSALDNDTEEKIMNEIYDMAKNKTLIIIAHRLSTINKCERKIQL